MEPSAVGEFVPAVLKGIRPRRGSVLEQVRRGWAAAAGPPVAKRTRVAGFERGVLTIEVASAALKHDLATFRQGELLEALAKALPGPLVRELRFRVSSLA